MRRFSFLDAGLRHAVCYFEPENDQPKNMPRYTDNEIIIPYCTDASNGKGYADELVIPDSVNEVVEFMRSTRGMVTLSGGGTGLGGGRIPDGGSIVSLERFQACTYDSALKQLTVQSGVSLADVHRIASEYGCFFPPDATEWGASVGGTMATNASGARSYRYGASRHHVVAIDVLLANGELMRLRRGQHTAVDGILKLPSAGGDVYSIPVPAIPRPLTSKNAAGLFLVPNLDAIDLFIGSEGTLGVITAATLQLQILPESVTGMIIFFQTSDECVSFVEAIHENELRRLVTPPRLVEYFSSSSLAVMRTKTTGIPDNAHAALWVEIEHASDNADEVLEQWFGWLKDYTPLGDETWIAGSDAGRERLRRFRHALPSGVYERLTATGQRKIGTDFAVPHSYLRQLVENYAEYEQQFGDRMILFGHIGNAHLHANFFYANDSEEREAQNAYMNLLEFTLRVGGTVSAEHGIGRIKKEYLRKMVGDDTINTYRAIKQTLDPHWRLNNGVMFDRV
ncbi:MAG: FAD-binding oxidoreductase [Candidatus Kapabacteria bacterium]|nr:FAD-binding oxidoreductase [Candidatus Kapabacteria bacterium]